MLFEYGNIFSKNGQGLKNLNEELLLSGLIFGNISEKSTLGFGTRPGIVNK